MYVPLLVQSPSLLEAAAAAKSLQSLRAWCFLSGLPASRGSAPWPLTSFPLLARPPQCQDCRPSSPWSHTCRLVNPLSGGLQSVDLKNSHQKKKKKKSQPAV